jgi:hypothetical protein
MLRVGALFAYVLLMGCLEEADACADGGCRDSAPSRCVVDEDCDDGRFCTGMERCALEDPRADVRGCLPGSACDGVCDEVAHTCDGLCVDLDGDGASDAACGGTDCDDSSASVYPGATEVCDLDGRDEDCDPSTLGVDGDGDGDVSSACCNADGATSRCGRDCDDTDEAVSPSAVETCNGRDDDCDGSIDEGVQQMLYRDADMDGTGSDGETMLGCASGMGWSSECCDCDDDAPGRNPGAPEVCDQVDNDCDGNVDEGLPLVVCLRDADEDGSPVSGASMTACACPDGWAIGPLDCRDDNPLVHPAQTMFFAEGYPISTGSIMTNLRSFDYNCSGAEEKEPLAPCALGLIGSCPSGFVGPADTSVACGRPVEYLRCASNCASTSLGTRPLACR